MSDESARPADNLIEVRRLVASRYSDNQRPADWDSRVGGIDIVEDVGGSRIKLLSTGMQSPPQSGWKLVVLDGDVENGYTWTLHGIVD